MESLCNVLKFTGCCERLISCLGRSDLRGLTKNTKIEPARIWRAAALATAFQCHAAASANAKIDYDGSDLLRDVRRVTFSLADRVCGNGGVRLGLRGPAYTANQRLYYTNWHDAGLGNSIASLQEQCNTMQPICSFKRSSLTPVR